MRILMIEDDELFADWVDTRLQSEGYEIVWAKSGEEGLEKTGAYKYPIALIDYKLPGINGLETIERMRRLSPATRIVFFTSYGDHKLALKSLQLGASEYLNKPFNFDNLSFIVYRLLKHTEPLNSGYPDDKTIVALDSVIYKSAIMNDIVTRIPQIAAAEMSVLISGETGTGKDFITQAILSHPSNPRLRKPMFSVNCIAIPDNLVESELFGHAKGSFTGAVTDKKGFFEEANGGTIFLDEISGASSAIQGKLLRILENGHYYRLGDTTSRTTNVVVIAATNRNLIEDVESGQFRKDLYYRLSGIQIELPCLRERREDILPLAKHFLMQANNARGKTAYFTPSALDALESADWPGNIRQLKNTVVSAVILTQQDAIDADVLPSSIRNFCNQNDSPSASIIPIAHVREESATKAEREYIVSVLKKHHGNITAAAHEAGINRQNMTKKIKKLGVDPNEFRA